MTLRQQKILKFVIYTVVGGWVIYAIFHKMSFEEFFENLKNANFIYVFLSVLGGILAVVIRGLRWQLMLAPLGYKTRFSDSYHSVMSGYLVNLGIPRAGEVSRCVMMSEASAIPIQTLIGTVVTERILDLIMLALVMVLAVALQMEVLYEYVTGLIKDNLGGAMEQIQWWWVVIAVTFLIAMGYLVVRLLRGPIGKKVAGFFSGLSSLWTLKKPFLFILYTVGIWVCYLLMTWFILEAFPFSAHFGPAEGLSVLVFSSLGVIIPAPAGSATMFSVKEGLRLVYGFTESQGRALGVVLFSANILMIIVMGTISYVYMMMQSSKRKNNELSATTA